MAEYIDREEMLERFDRRAKLAVGDKRVGVASIRAFIENAPVADAVSRGVYEQVIWERDVAIKQLRSIGKSLGENMDDVAPRRHGEWMKHYRSGVTVSDGFVSSCCDMWNNRSSDFCPDCGALMNGGADNAE